MEPDDEPSRPALVIKPDLGPLEDTSCEATALEDQGHDLLVLVVHALERLVDGVLGQCLHAEQPRLSPDVLSWLAAEGHFPDRAVHHHELEHRLATAVAGVRAVVATFATAESRAGELIFREVEFF